MAQAPLCDRSAAEDTIPGARFLLAFEPLRKRETGLLQGLDDRRLTRRVDLGDDATQRLNVEQGAGPAEH